MRVTDTVMFTEKKKKKKTKWFHAKSEDCCYFQAGINQRIISAKYKYDT